MKNHPPTTTAAVPEADSPEQTAHSSLSGHRARIDVNYSPAVLVTNDAAFDYEPAIITDSFGSNTVTTSAWSRWDGNNLPTIYAAKSTNGGAFTSLTQLPPVTVNGQYFPQGNNVLLSENPYVSSGLFPKRTYAVDVSFTPTVTAGPSAIVVYTNENTNQSFAWNGQALTTTNYPYFFDKPSIWTSWDYSRGDLGYTYVAFVNVRVDGLVQANGIRLYRMSNADGSWQYVNAQFSGLGYQSPMVTTDSRTGDVYLTWVGWNNGTINMARSQDFGNTFSNPVTLNLGAGSFFGPNDTIDATTPTRASTLLMVRPNSNDSATGSIGVVYHRKLHEAGCNCDRAVAYFVRFNISTQTWDTPRAIGHGTESDAFDHFYPSLDPSTDASYVVKWYDKRNDWQNHFYQVMAERINADGTPIDLTDTVVTPGLANPFYLPHVSDNGPFYIGDYQDIWNWMGPWYGAATYINYNGFCDIWETVITN